MEFEPDERFVWETVRVFRKDGIYYGEKKQGKRHGKGVICYHYQSKDEWLYECWWLDDAPVYGRMISYIDEHNTEVFTGKFTTKYFWNPQYESSGKYHW